MPYAMPPSVADVKLSLGFRMYLTVKVSLALKEIPLREAVLGAILQYLRKPVPRNIVFL